jgi:6,7-dimethyl-8-ribityllumazine synthase
VKNSENRILIVVARFNDMITKCLLEGAKDCFEEQSFSSFDVVWVPGCFELPLVAKKAAASGRYKAVVCLGAVIRGETPHFDYVAGEAARGIMDASLDTGIPIIFGVLTTNTIEQALSRSGIKYGNKGRDAASAALSMIKVLNSL